MIKKGKVFPVLN